jgi:hypothetical protein
MVFLAAAVAGASAEMALASLQAETWASGVNPRQVPEFACEVSPPIAFASISGSAAPVRRGYGRRRSAHSSSADWEGRSGELVAQHLFDALSRQGPHMP